MATYTELLAKRLKLDQQIAAARRKELDATRKKAKDMAAEAGFDLSDVLDLRRNKGPQPARYAKKSDRSRTWSGMGRKPNWFIDGDFVEM